MRRRGFILAVVLGVLAVALFLRGRTGSGDAKPNAAARPAIEERASQDSEAALSGAPTPLADVPEPNDPRLTRLPDGRVLYNPSVEVSRTIDGSMTSGEMLGVISEILAHYRYAYRENPVGENSEITAQLLGNNPKKVVFIAPDCTALKGNELVDSSGSPLFFHALSAERMHVVSAGPDGELWTDDDVSLSDGLTTGP